MTRRGGKSHVRRGVGREDDADQERGTDISRNGSKKLPCLHLCWKGRRVCAHYFISILIICSFYKGIVWHSLTSNSNKSQWPLLLSPPSYFFSISPPAPPPPPSTTSAFPAYKEVSYKLGPPIPLEQNKRRKEGKEDAEEEDDEGRAETQLVDPFSDELTSIDVDAPSCYRLRWMYKWDSVPTLFHRSGSAPDDMVKVELKNVDCDLAVIAAGMERGGSKLQYEMLIEAALALGAEVFDTSGFAIAEGGGRTARRAAQPLESRAGIPIKQQGKRILVFKSHFYSDLSKAVCRRQLFFTTHRQLEDAALSIYKLNWAKNLAQMIERLDYYLTNHGCWGFAGAEDWRYESFSAHILEYGTDAMRKMAAALRIPEQDVERIATSWWYQRRMSQWQKKDSHGSKMTASTKIRLSNVSIPEQWIEVIRRRYQSLGHEYVLPK